MKNTETIPMLQERVAKNSQAIKEMMKIMSKYNDALEQGDDIDSLVKGIKLNTKILQRLFDNREELTKEIDELFMQGS